MSTFANKGGDSKTGDGGHGEATQASIRGLVQLQNSQAAMRDTTKWLVAAAAAVGAIVVGGLQLSSLPTGATARILALVGVAAALLGVVLILSRAGGVLAAGYTTLGELADLKKTLHDSKAYEAVQVTADKMAEVAQGAGTATVPRSVLVAVHLRFLRLQLKIDEWRQGRVEDEGLRIEKMLYYLNKDTKYFTNGLAVDITELYDTLATNDENILTLRSSEQGRPVISAPRRPSGFARWPARHLPSQASPESKNPQLENAEWRRLHLETAAGTLVAFANQKLIERRFRRLQRALFWAGLLIFGGAAAFAWAVSTTKTKPLAISQPTVVDVNIVSSAYKGCPPGTVLRGVAVGGSWDEPIVVLGKSGACPFGEFKPKADQAFIVPRTPVTPSTTGAPSPSPAAT